VLSPSYRDKYTSITASLASLQNESRLLGADIEWRITEMKNDILRTLTLVGEKLGEGLKQQVKEGKI
jgi:hypothetical protein